MACTINFNSDSTGSFYAGDIVTGTVILELKNDQKFQSIDLKVTGTCKASWTRSMPTMPYIKIYSEKKKVLSLLMTDIFRDYANEFRPSQSTHELLATKLQFMNNSQKCLKTLKPFGINHLGSTLPAGIHQYPFHFALPADIPSSFESSIAKVIYTVKIKSKPVYKLRKMASFNVLGNINLNHIEELLMPSFNEFRKTFRNSGKFTICVKTYKAFAPKQTIPFEITIINEKKVKIRKINVILIQKIRYNVQSGWADEEKKICKTEYKKFSQNIAEICFFNMEIPHLIPSSLNLIDPMVDISYIFRLQVIFPFHFTLQEEIPVTVATAPVIHCEF